MDYEYVDHPEHYNQEGRMECIDEMITMFGVNAVITFCKLTAYKYTYRAGSKPGEDHDRDIKKATWYLQKADELKHYRLVRKGEE
jgi:hypothetical protein